MKRLFLLPILLFLFAKANAQNRWMYLTTSVDSSTYIVDTLANDLKQLESYDGHNHVILIWVRTTYSKSNKPASVFDYTMAHIAVDTTISQIEVTSNTNYKNGNVVVNNATTYPKWIDVIPETIGEIYIKYCRALHDKNIMADLIVNAVLHDVKPLQSDNKKN